MSRKQFKVVPEEEDSEIEDNDDVDPDLQADEQLQSYLREMSIQATGQPQGRGRSASQPSSPLRSPERVARPASAPPPLSPARPSRSTYGGRTPPNVRRFRDPSTGYPDAQRLAQASGQITGSKQDIARLLTMKGREGKAEVLATGEGKTMRKHSLLSQKKNFWYESKSGRHYPMAQQNYNLSHLQPQNPAAPDLTDPRFHQTIKAMKTERYPSAIMPTGRVGFGDISQYDLGEMRRSLEEARNQNRLHEFNIPGLEHETPAHWKPKEVAFSHRLRSLSEGDRDSYYELQSESNPYLVGNRGADGRMVPKPTIGQLREYNEKRNKQSKHRHQKTQHLARDARLWEMYKRSILPSAINVHSTIYPLPPISEYDDVPYAFNPTDVDPETNLIPTTRSVDAKKRLEKELAQKTAAQQQWEKQLAAAFAPRQHQQQLGPTMSATGSVGLGSPQSPHSTSSAQPSTQPSGPRLSRPIYGGRRSQAPSAASRPPTPDTDDDEDDD